MKRLSGRSWSLDSVLEAAPPWASRGAVFDAPLGVPGSYLAAAAASPRWPSPRTFPEFLRCVSSDPGYFDLALSAAAESGLFTANALGTFGNTGHNSLRAPGAFTVDIAVGRSFRLREWLTLQTRGEAFNSLNHVNFGGPNTNISSSTFGQITSVGAQRVLQGSMKLVS